MKVEASINTYKDSEVSWGLSLNFGHDVKLYSVTNYPKLVRVCYEDVDFTVDISELIKAAKVCETE